MTKSTHFISIKASYYAEDYSKLYINENGKVARGVPIHYLWLWFPIYFFILCSSQKCLDTQVNLSTTFHTQADEQAERMVQTLEDIMRACISDFKCNLDDHLPLFEFSYKHSYHLCIGMTPFEVLFGKGVGFL